jgi:hypothetical protein
MEGWRPFSRRVYKDKKGEDDILPFEYDVAGGKITFSFLQPSWKP